MRQTRVKKPDRITNPESIASPIDEAIYHALRPLDQVAADFENEWGIDRLPGLVSPETASRFGQAKAKLDAAIDARDPEAVVKRAAVMIRGWKALVAEARENGAEPVSRKVRVVRSDSGRAYGIAIDQATARAAIQSGDFEGVNVWALDEVARVLESHELKLVNKVKEEFPGANVVSINEAAGKKKDDLNDDLPF